jgi:hypothetical protein
LIAVGIVFVLVGEFLLEKYDGSKYQMIWHALSIGGAFSLVIGLIWMIIQFFAMYDSWYSVIILLAVGVGLILIGEAVKVNKK